MGSLVPRNVLDEVPDIVVLLGRQPFRSSDRVVLRRAQAHQAAVVGREWIQPAEAQFGERVRVGIALRPSGDEAGVCHPGFSDEARRPDLGVAHHRRATQILLPLAAETASVEIAGQRRGLELLFVDPADAAEEAVVVGYPVIDPYIPLLYVSRGFACREIVASWTSTGGREVLVLLRVLADQGRCDAVEPIHRNLVVPERVAYDRAVDLPLCVPVEDLAFQYVPPEHVLTLDSVHV